MNFRAVQGMKCHVECMRNEFMHSTGYEMAYRMHEE